jgi:hypothetical protein
MKLKNAEVIERFLNNRRAESHTGNLHTDGTALTNYRTTIAYWHNGYLFINCSKYSVTTSKIQNMLHREALAQYLYIIQIFGLGTGDKLIEIARNYK